MGKQYYPAFLNLTNKKCVVVGGGKVAERKITSLLECGARVLVISPELTAKLSKYKTSGSILHKSRQYRKGDLKGAFLVIAATSNDLANKAISNEAKNLLNVVDVPELANFIVPAVVKRGPLQIAISTSGTSPAMAAAIRKELEIRYSKQFGSYLSFLGRLRRDIQKNGYGKDDRERFFKKTVSQEILKLLRTKGFKAVKNQVPKKILNSPS